MPDDNSCLFRAFSTAVLPGDDLGMPELRSIIASAIQADPEKYTRAVLEQPPDDYCRWIQTEDAWGGAIEIDILSRFFNIQICSVDVQVRPSNTSFQAMGINHRFWLSDCAADVSPPARSSTSSPRLRSFNQLELLEFNRLTGSSDPGYIHLMGLGD